MNKTIDNTSTDVEFDDALNNNLASLGEHNGVTNDLSDELLDEAIEMTEKELGRSRSS